MSNVVISLENVSKSYQLGAIGSRTLRDDLARNWAWLRGRPDPLLKIGQADRRDRLGETLWALKDISFKIEQGEVLGIIGRNGAGKSTLLKILSRVTAPTSGAVKIKGRIASLLEVGTGFHPELTGRENIFLNGSILGMQRQETQRKFDEIVDFSGVEKFIDTPVKRYSSGMYVRLAFAVAAHLEPEILIVDEVLAVGDAEFQKKCLGKMGEVARIGRTVLFVSHNIAAVLSLCSKAYWLDKGKVVRDGNVKDVIDDYMKSSEAKTTLNLSERTDRGGDGTIRFTSISIESVVGKDGRLPVHCVDPLRIRIGYDAREPLSKPRFLISINDYSDAGIYFLDSDVTGGFSEELPACGYITCTTQPINITPGQCYINIAVYNGNTLADHVQHVHNLTIEPVDFYGTGKLPLRQNSVCFIGQTWLSETREAVHD